MVWLFLVVVAAVVVYALVRQRERPAWIDEVDREREQSSREAELLAREAAAAAVERCSRESHEGEVLRLRYNQLVTKRLRELALHRWGADWLNWGKGKWTISSGAHGSNCSWSASRETGWSDDDCNFTPYTESFSITIENGKFAIDRAYPPLARKYLERTHQRQYFDLSDQGLTEAMKCLYRDGPEKKW